MCLGGGEGGGNQYDTNTHLIQPPMSKHIEKGVNVRFTGEVEP